MTRREIVEKTVEIVRGCVPELEGVELREETAVGTDMGLDSMNFILVVCELETAFGVRIPNRQWGRFQTLGDVVDAIEKYRK